MAKKNVHEINIKIDGADWKTAVDNAFKEKSKSVTVAGFRKGKVPRDVYDKKFGEASLYPDAADHSVNVAYLKALETSKLVPIVQPKVEIVGIDETGVEFKFTIVTKPEMKIKKYKGLGVKPEDIKVTKEEIDHEIGHILEKYSELRTKEKGKVENGNVAVIDFEGFNDGVAFAGGKGENYDLEIGSNTFIPGFEEQLVGMKSNDEKDIKVTFPEEYPSEELKGKEVTFKVKINEIKEKVQRELDEELFEDLAMEGVNSLETLEKEVESSIKANREMEAENKYVDRLFEAIAKNVEVDIPEELVEEEIARLMGRYEEQLKMQGITLDLYYQFTGSTEADLRSQLEKEAYNHVLYRMMLEEVMELEKISVSDEDAQKEATELASKYNMDREKFLEMFGGIEMIRYDLEMRRVIELLKELNK